MQPFSDCSPFLTLHLGRFAFTSLQCMTCPSKNTSCLLNKPVQLLQKLVSNIFRF